MPKWADFGISAKREDVDGNISKVLIHSLSDSGPSSSTTEETKGTVISKIGLDKSYVTIIKPNGNWVKGASVHVYKDKYIRTDGNSKEKDNLESLPFF
jgi:hypothetical protein